MRNRKNNKRALIVSALSLLLCVSMLVGSTMAWFTDNASTGVNTIQAGKLDIDLLDKDNNSLDGKTIGFADKDDNSLWEPGCRYTLQEIKLINNGNLHAKYRLSINAVIGDVDLSKVIDIYEGETKLGTLDQFLNQTEGFKEGTIAPGDTLSFGTLTLVMQTTAGNEYQGKSIENIAVTVQATQAAVESDSFGSDYDEKAEFAPIADVWTKDENGEGEVGELPEPEKIPVIDETTGEPVVDENGEPVYEEVKSNNDGIGDGYERSLTRISTASELAALAEAVNAGENFVDMNFELMNDIDLNNIEWTPIGSSADTPFGGNFNGNGHTIYNLKVSGGEYAGLFGYIKGTTANYQPSISDLTIENVSISGTNAGAIAGGGRYTNRNTWYGGVQVYQNINLKGNVKIDGTNVGGILGSGWLDVRINAKNITVSANEGSYIKGSNMAGGVFCSAPHCDNVSNVTSNIDVIGEKIAGGIAAGAAWVWDNISCTGDVTLNTATASQYQAGTMFGSISYNTYWINYNAAQGIINGMTNLSATGTLTVNNSNSNGCPSNMIGLSYQTGTSTVKLFNYEGGKVVLAE